jgi:hypothetical protein
MRSAIIQKLGQIAISVPIPAMKYHAAIVG